jgi:hypothetical protein
MDGIGRWHGLVIDCPEPAALDAAERAVLALGARRLDAGEGGRSFRVFADPAGHPFCLTV